jgi:hypothetical protein
VTALRHLLIATSASPDFSHSQAAQTVCALLTAEFAGLVPKVTIGRVCPDKPVCPDTASRLALLGVDCVDLPSHLCAYPPPVHNTLEAAAVVFRSVLLGDGSRDCPRPNDVRALASGIDTVGADAVLLFWDTLAEFAVPQIKTPAFGYLARPPYAAAMSRVRAEPLGRRRIVSLALLSAQSRRHIERMTALWAAGNICSIDAAHYVQNGVGCSYIPNSWHDPVGDGWKERRAHCEGLHGASQILGNIGALDATGNSFGLHYLGTKVLPVLSSIAGEIDWTINICGPRQLSPVIASALAHPRVVIKGFVPDIDQEVLSSGIFLLLNNAGPYTGGYTRVAYAFATGACLIAHRHLAISMPELKHEQNCLLADTPDGIAVLIDRALRNVALRRQIGAGARRTYEMDFAPRRVAGRLVQMMEAGLSAQGERRVPSAAQGRSAEPQSAEGFMG